MKIRSNAVVLFSLGALLFVPRCIAFNVGMLAKSPPVAPIVTEDAKSPVMLPPTRQPSFTPSSQVNYTETVIIKAPPPLEDEPQPIPVKRFQWLQIESKPLNPTQQNR